MVACITHPPQPIGMLSQAVRVFSLTSLLGMGASPSLATRLSQERSVSPARPASGSSTSVPSELTQLESLAEDIGDEVGSGHWNEASALAAKARRALDAIAPASPQEVIARAREHLAAVEGAIERRHALDSQFAANALSGDVVTLYGGYQPIVPVDVMRLDVLLRRSQLEGMGDSPQRARAPLSEAQAIWARLRGEPPLANTLAARRFDQEMAAVQRAVSSADAKALQRSAGVALEGVDSLEHVFERAHRGEH